MTVLRVLVVEDDAMIGMLLGEMLVEMGYEVCAIAATEEEAVAEAATCQPNLLLVDEQLREGSGLAAVTRIVRDRHVPCIFMSGAPMRRQRPGAMMLHKPFLEADLMRAIQSVVGNADEPVLSC